jgi:hypothetical protein
MCICDSTNHVFLCSNSAKSFFSEDHKKVTTATTDFMRNPHAYKLAGILRASLDYQRKTHNSVWYETKAHAKKALFACQLGEKIKVINYPKNKIAIKYAYWHLFEI